MSKCGLDLEPNTETTKEVYTRYDAAIDLEASEIEKYQDTLDKQHIALNPEFTPVIFTIAPVSWLEFARACHGREADADVFRELFRLGVKDWRHWYRSGDNGSRQPFLPKFQARVGRTAVLHDDVFKEVPDKVMLDIGHAVYRISHFASDRDPPEDEHLKNS